MTKMILTEDVVEQMNEVRLFELLVFKGLPISQAVAVHLCDDLKMRPVEAGALVGLTNLAIHDARRKGRAKLKNL